MIIVLVSLGVLVAASSLNLPLLTSVTVVVVDGRSMLPTLQSGDLVFVVKVPPTSIRVGDVIVYRFTGIFYGIPLNNVLIIHRVIYVYYHNGTLCFITKGDNNQLPDPGYPSYCGYVNIGGVEVSGVPYKFVIGEVVGGKTPLAIPYIGALSLIMRPQQGVT
ncbi:MAG: signal peptidase I [Acidilobus sp.]